jgi:hypothetical protein
VRSAADAELAADVAAEVDGSPLCCEDDEMSKLLVLQAGGGREDFKAAPVVAAAP